MSSYSLAIACKGDPAAARAMWLAISRQKEGAGEREFSFDELSREAEGEGFSSSSTINPDVFFNTVSVEDSSGQPEKYYPLLAKAFPGLAFFIIQERTEGEAFFLASFESKNGRMRTSGKWEDNNPRLSGERRAWLGALQGHWLAAAGLPPEAAPDEDAGEEAEPWTNADERLAAIEENPDALARIKKQTPHLCHAAVEKSGLSLRHVKKQSAKLCLAAVKQDGLALEFVREQTREICRAALEQNYLSYGFVRETSPSLYRQFSEAFANRLAAIEAE